MTLLILTTVLFIQQALSNEVAAPSRVASWLVNNPPYFHHANRSGIMVDVRKDSAHMQKFIELSDTSLIDASSDGEVVDAIEHYFWGMRDGMAIELGALDGSLGTNSMTFSYESTLGWNRILIEGNPAYRNKLKKNSPLSFGVNAAICSTPSTVHFAANEHVGGIIEFMTKDFLKPHHPEIWNACSPPGNISSLNAAAFPNLHPVECIPMSHVLRKAHVKHVNFFILDVEGGEYEVLKSIDWARVKFDVLCIETDEIFRPKGYRDMVTAFLGERGYVNTTQQQGRNTWYIDKDFVPSSRPGLDSQCYNGVRKVTSITHKTPFISC